MAVFSRCTVCGERGVVSESQPVQAWTDMVPTMAQYVHHACADNNTPSYFTRLDRIPTDSGG